MDQNLHREHEPNIVGNTIPLIIIRGINNVLQGNTVEGITDGVMVDTGNGTQYLE